MDHAGLAGARIPGTGNLLLNPREMRGTPGRHPGIMTAGDFAMVTSSAIIDRRYSL